MLLLDTTVLAYATGDLTHPLADPARRLIRAIGDGEVRATTTPEVLQEFLHIRSRRRSRSDARDLVQRFAELLSPLTIVEESTIVAAAEEFVDRPGIGAFDSVLVALAGASDDLELVTADRAILALADVPTRALEPTT